MIFIYSRPLFLGEQYARWVCFCLSCVERSPLDHVRERYGPGLLEDIQEVMTESIREGFISKGQEPS